MDGLPSPRATNSVVVVEVVVSVVVICGWSLRVSKNLYTVIFVKKTYFTFLKRAKNAKSTPPYNIINDSFLFCRLLPESEYLLENAFYKKLKTTAAMRTRNFLRVSLIDLLESEKHHSTCYRQKRNTLSWQNWIVACPYCLILLIEIGCPLTLWYDRTRPE